MLKKTLILTALLATIVGLSIELGRVLAERNADPCLEYTMLEVDHTHLTVEDHGTHCNWEPPVNFDLMVESAAMEYGINPRVLALTVYRESGCKVDALGGSGEIGLTQVNPSVWAETLAHMGMVDLYDPHTNLRAGAYILSQMRDRANTPKEAIRRYNGSGPKARKYAREQVATYRTLYGEDLRL
jgi:hypothetical protein